eukprot:2720511-Alexandrium_andersonii.AAC.1
MEVVPGADTASLTQSYVVRLTIHKMIGIGHSLNLCLLKYCVLIPAAHACSRASSMPLSTCCRSWDKH